MSSVIFVLFVIGGLYVVLRFVLPVAAVGIVMIVRIAIYIAIALAVLYLLRLLFQSLF